MVRADPTRDSGLCGTEMLACSIAVKCVDSCPAQNEITPVDKERKVLILVF
jgi:hypothetical protein